MLVPLQNMFILCRLKWREGKIGDKSLPLVIHNNYNCNENNVAVTMRREQNLWSAKR